MTIPLDIIKFRQNYPEFSSESEYPDSMLESKYLISSCYISNSSNFFIADDCLEVALQLMLAHVVSLSVRVTQGAATGQVISASEDGVSVSFTAPSNSSQFSWWLNTTPYGQQLLALLEASFIGGDLYWWK